MRAWIIPFVALPLLAGCGQPKGADASGAASAPAALATAEAPAPGPASAAPSAASPKPLAGRTGEVSNPDNAAMVFLYYSLAGLDLPVDRWVEQDTTVRFAQPIDRAGAREIVRGKITAGAAAMANIGMIRLTMDADLSDFDPSYNEFTVRALAPSSMVNFEALGEKVSVKFANAQKAQRWSLPAAESQVIRDRIQNPRNVVLEVLLRVTGAQPAPVGGVINTEVVEYELRNRDAGTTVARIRVEP